MHGSPTESDKVVSIYRTSAYLVFEFRSMTVEEETSSVSQAFTWKSEGLFTTFSFPKYSGVEVFSRLNGRVNIDW